MKKGGSEISWAGPGEEGRMGRNIGSSENIKILAKASMS